MNKKLLSVLFVLSMILLLLFTLAPVSSWNNTETGEEDTKFEKFGPRADELLIKLYSGATATGITFGQINFKLDGVSTLNSDWGAMYLSFYGSSQIQYLNLISNGTWSIQNLPVLSVEGDGIEQTQCFWFPLGVPIGTDVTTIDYGYGLTDYTMDTPPVEDMSAPVGDDDYVVYNGGGDGPFNTVPATAGPVVGGAVVDPVQHKNENFPNQEAGPKECVPAAASNSLQFLNDKHKLNIKAADITIAKMKTACGFVPGWGCPRDTWWKEKDAYMKSEKLPITTKRILPKDISEIADEIDAGQDIEAELYGHTVAVVGISDLGGGKHSVTVKHDKDQDKNPGGLATETGIWDSNTGKWAPGDLANYGLNYFVVECPKRVDRSTPPEKSGPDLDRTLIMKYGSIDGLCDALEVGEVDIIDSLLTDEWVDRWSSPPYNEIIALSWCGSGYRAYRKYYCGGTAGVPVFPDDGENQYRGTLWVGIINQTSCRPDGWGTFLNAHPEGFERGDGEYMTIRYGIYTSEVISLNPLYASDWRVLDKIYDWTTRLDPLSLTEQPWLVSAYTFDTYVHAVYGACGRVTLTLRSDLTWQDGTPITAADFYFSWVELDDILDGRGLPSPSWAFKTENVLSFQMLDAYNFEVLFDTMDLWFLEKIMEVPVLPIHVWKPIVELGDPYLFAPDPNMVGNGPWRLKEYVACSYFLLVANTPDSTVTTNLPGSGAVTSPNGFHRYWPFYADTYETTARRSKVDYEENITLISDFANLWDNTTEIATEVFVNDTIYINEVEQVGFNEKACYIDMHLMARALDFGYSEVHYQDLPGPMAVLTYHKRLYIHLAGYFVLTLDGTSVLSLDWDCLWVKIDIYRYYRVFDHSWIESCTTYPCDIELSWHTIIEDIAGSNWYADAGVAHPYPTQLPTPDIKVDIKDIALVAKAYGSYPGHIRWSTIADITCDYQIDIRDIAAIAKQFGWVG